MRDFVLSEALAGAKLVTRDGRDVEDFKLDDSDWDKNYPYAAKIGGYEQFFTSDGNFVAFEEGKNDLFMAEDGPSNNDDRALSLLGISPRYEFIHLAQSFVLNGMQSEDAIEAAEAIFEAAECISL